MIKNILSITYGLLIVMSANAQEFEARVNVNASRISSQVDRKVFQTLQTGLQTFLNNRKWTNETFQPNERVVCSFLLNIEKTIGTNVYQATLGIQAARPVYNSSYQTALINHQDDAVTFKYVEFQPLEFNENRVQGTDPVAANLTAIFAYYAYIILGLDYNSFALRGGDAYFQKAQNMYENETEGRNAILNSLQLINTVNTDIPNSMVVQFFFQGRSNELTKIFKKAAPDEKNRALDILTKVDIANSGLYKQELK